uniref:ANK_REP_REGION domain-containing protein n=1 Tax=Meloidogyne floridensis TaxID=298350 RepID=A0A915NP48_9BILA
MASSIGNYALVEEYILNNKKSVNYKNSKGWTALMYGAQARNIEVCKLLLDNGANPELTNDDSSVFTLYEPRFIDKCLERISWLLLPNVIVAYGNNPKSVGGELLVFF